MHAWGEKCGNNGCMLMYMLLHSKICSSPYIIQSSNCT